MSLSLSGWWRLHWQSPDLQATEYIYFSVVLCFLVPVLKENSFHVWSLKFYVSSNWTPSHWAIFSHAEVRECSSLSKRKRTVIIAGMEYDCEIFASDMMESYGFTAKSAGANVSGEAFISSKGEERSFLFFNNMKYSKQANTVKHLSFPRTKSFIYGYWYKFAIFLLTELLFYDPCCSLFSRYGIHSMPAILIFNQTSRMWFHDSKDLDSLSKFYRRTTGTCLK